MYEMARLEARLPQRPVATSHCYPSATIDGQPPEDLQARVVELRKGLVIVSNEVIDLLQAMVRSPEQVSAATHR